MLDTFFNMKVKDLAKFKQNPRKISAAQQRILAKTLDTYGDLSGVVWNANLNELIGGHQRTDVFSPEDEIIITESFKEVDRQGTTAIGYIIHDGAKYPYREVLFDRAAHVAASIAANKGGGEWDWGKLKDLAMELDTGGFDMELTGFDLVELENLIAMTPVTPLDYSSLDGANVDAAISLMGEGVRKAIQIEFLPEDYEEAQKLISYWREQGVYIGQILVTALKAKQKLE